jgi:hypothetical protein
MALRYALLLLTVAFALEPEACGASSADGGKATPAAVSDAGSWPVVTSLKATIQDWARRAGWPAPQFLTDADWPVDVPDSISGSIEQALKVLAQGFGRAAARPRIELTGNHVIVVTERGAE